MNVTNVQNTGILYKDIKINEIRKKVENIEEVLRKSAEEISEIKETDSRPVKEYNLNGRYREDYDTEKHLDIFA